MNNIKGVIFDYGGTIDTNSRHWAAVLWEKYQEISVPVSYEAFREAYVFGERSLAKHPYIRPEHNFFDVLKVKTQLQFEFLAENGHLAWQGNQLTEGALKVAQLCYDYVLQVLQTTRPVVAAMAAKYKVVLVSNFYGNIQTILKDFELDSYFLDIVESSVVGVRKPDPAIYALGVKAINLPAEEVLVVGDSFSKDMVPAKKVGCKVAWLKGEGWGGEEIDESLPDLIITNLSQLTENL